MKNKLIKLIFFNSLVLLILIVALESTAYIGRKVLNKPSVGWLYKKYAEINECTSMTTNPIMGHIHDHNDKCKIRGGISNGSFVFYKSNPNEKYKSFIITLGGSTTDGFYNHISKGFTWPYYLHQRTSNDYKIGVINGGVGAYNSNHELLKLILDIRKINFEKKVIISLNGINEFPFNSNTNYDTWKIKNFPFMDSKVLKMFNDEAWLIQNQNFVILPSTISLLNYFKGDHSIQENFRTSLKIASISSSLKKYDYADIWYDNVKLMHSISKTTNSKYLVFLQPTMGLNNISDKAPVDTNDFKLINSMEKDYIRKLNTFYDKAKVYCKTLNFCFDISSTVKPTGNVYNDPRHHNEFGNKLLSDAIFKILKENNYFYN